MVHNLKLRASFGAVSNQSIGATQHWVCWFPTNYDGYGSDATAIPCWTGQIPLLPDANLWEMAPIVCNIGLDASVLGRSLSSAAEWNRNRYGDSLLLQARSVSHNAEVALSVNQGEVRTWCWNSPHYSYSHAHNRDIWLFGKHRWNVHLI